MRAAPQARVAPQEQGVDPSDEMARKRAAFIAQERARQPAVYGAESVAEPGDYFEKSYAPRKSDKSVTTAYLLWFFVGGFSAHRLYIGGFPLAARQLAYLGALIVMTVLAIVTHLSGIFIWGVILALIVSQCSLWLDIFRIPKMCREHNSVDSEGLRNVFG
jgi:hypothetical protein